ncbi:MAG: DUF4105 domain-containing protein [Chitinophagales bacterium]
MWINSSNTFANTFYFHLMYLRPLLLALIVSCLLIFTGINANAAQKLSGKARVSLITCGQGPDLYEAFGHTAIRVYDPENGINNAYNYGIFSFNQANFYANFAMGHLWYRLGVNDFDRFVYSYEYHKRSVYEQVLNFDQEQKQALFDTLERNRLPENRYYLYNYFFHNCSTIPRDIIELASGHTIEYSYKGEKFKAGKSIRQLVDEYIIHNSWGNFGIDIALGAEIDEKATFHEYLYLPEYLMDAFASATIMANGKKKPLVQKTLIHYQSDVDYMKENISPGPITVFWLFFGLLALLTLWGFKTRNAFKGIDFLFFLILGLNGSVLFFISFFTDHTATENFNLLWNLPTHLVFAFVLLRKKQGKFISLYLMLTIFLCLISLADDLILPQNFHPAVIPVLLTIILRSSFLLYHNKLNPKE